MMAAKSKTKGQVTRGSAVHPLLERLKPGEAASVLRRLLEAHPNLSSEAEEIARWLLHQVTYEDVAQQIEDEIRALDYDDLNGRAGRHEWGYVEPAQAAWEILEETVEPFLDDMKRHRELGLEAEALEILKGMLLGYYRLSERKGGDVLEWAPDFPAEAAGNALEIWFSGGDNGKSRSGRREERLLLSADFLSMTPKWIAMIERIRKGRK